MNRLILIGNGFDLAHKLKTSYCDFIKDYLSKSINFFFEKGNYDDPLFEIRYKFSGHKFRDPTHSTPGSALNDWEVLKRNDYVIINIKSAFISDTLKRVLQINWVDLENDYFDQLLTLKDVIRGFDLEGVKKLNTEFEFLKIQLESYLKEHQDESETAFSNDYTNIFREFIKGEDIVTTSILDQLPKKLLILNFNYTSTLEKYKDACLETVPTQLNYIHGELGSRSNPIIFGFGDEFNKNYLEFEDLKNKELLKHIKSFGYFKTSNYHNLIRFIDDDDFQVYIFGHSLGLSDRTMLKQIFEHDSCKSIKIFYHHISEENSDYTDKTFDISSHFANKGIMRNKIVPFNLSLPMPQLS